MKTYNRDGQQINKKITHYVRNKKNSNGQYNNDA